MFVVISYSSCRKVVQSASSDPDWVLKIVHGESLDPARVLSKDGLTAIFMCDRIPYYSISCSLAYSMLEISRSCRHLTLKLNLQQFWVVAWSFVILASNTSALYPLDIVNWLCDICQFSLQPSLSFKNLVTYHLYLPQSHKLLIPCFHLCDNSLGYCIVYHGREARENQTIAFFWTSKLLRMTRLVFSFLKQYFIKFSLHCIPAINCALIGCKYWFSFFYTSWTGLWTYG